MPDRGSPKPPSRADQAAKIFDDALDLPEAKREAFLKDACAADEVLHDELVSMLRAHAEAGDFLQPRSDATAGRTSSPSPRPAPDVPSVGDTVGHYSLGKVIGEGGFGVVFMAEQRAPVRRQVALKIIKWGMDTQRVMARFAAERQTLAMMDHPGIARVFDAGATDAGRPYFVMELVQGTPLTEYCDAHRLDTQARLRLFSQVCLAVQHAHQKGVIHRDIKPSNVLVTIRDGAAAPKIIDFGIAKATKTGETERTMFTEQGQVIGTPAYMSPEQADTDGGDIDTRSDVYSLGVLLYELLTGFTPFEKKTLQGAGFSEMMRIIREVEPPKPSSRISLAHATKADGPTRSAAEGPSSGINTAEIAAFRRTDPLSLSRTLRGDLDWIVMRCLEKDRTRRYATVGALVDDIQRHLDDQPVTAGPPSAAYRFRKFVRRYRGAVAAGAVTGLVLVAATLVSTLFAWRESAARQRENLALVREVEQRQRADREADVARRHAEAAESARLVSEKRAEETRRVADFQADLLRGLDAGTLGRGIRDVFREQLRVALEREPVGEWPDRRSRTESEIEAALAAFDSCASVVQPADVARRVMDEFVLAGAATTVAEKFADQPLVQAQIRDALGAAYRALGLFESARAQYEEGLVLRRRERGGDHVEVADSLNNVATMLYFMGDFSGAEPLCREALAIHRKWQGEVQPGLATTLQNLGTLRLEAGDVDAAEGYFREALASCRKLLGDEHPENFSILSNLAGALYLKGDRAGAETVYRDTIALKRKRLGDEHREVAETLQNLASAVRARGDLSEAERLYREALVIQRKSLGHEHPDLARTLSNLASLLKAKGELAEVEGFYRESLAIRRKCLGNGHPDVANSLNNLAALLRDRGDDEEGEPLYREAIAIQEKALPAGHEATAISRSGLGRLLAKSAADPALAAEIREARLAEAESLLVSAEQDLARSASGQSPYRKRAIEFLIDLYEIRHSYSPEKGFDRKAVEWRETLQRPAPPKGR